MVFLAEEILPVPGKDTLSWVFDDLSYDPDKPVSLILAICPGAFAELQRSMWMLQDLIKGLYRPTKPVRL